MNSSFNYRSVSLATTTLVALTLVTLGNIIEEEWHPVYHLSPKAGWLSDPVGLIWFDGYYHVFYEHNPSAPRPQMRMHWGHARSKNMLDWEHLPVALSPSIDEDCGGIFTGSAVNDNGILTLVYSGNILLDEDDISDLTIRQVQCLATSEDGITFTKFGKVLESYATDGLRHIRDPKVWKEGNVWSMVLGIRLGNEDDDNDRGQVALYKSSDLRQWEFEGILLEADQGWGYMWECPDLFQLGDKHVLMISPQGIEPQGYKYRNRQQSGYFVGNWKPWEKFHVEQHFTEIDNGHDFFSPQTFLAPDGRRIIIGWMGMWKRPVPESEQNWAGMLTLPRELSLADDNSLRMVPIREAEDLRHNPEPIHLSTKVLTDEHIRLDSQVKAMEITMTWDLNASDAEKYGLRLGDAEYGAGGVYLYIDTQSQRLVLDRRYPQYGLSGYRSIALSQEGLLSLRVFFDHSSIEVFVNDGKACMTSRIYPTNEQRSLSLFAENGRATLKDSNRWILGNQV